MLNTPYINPNRDKYVSQIQKLSKQILRIENYHKNGVIIDKH